MELSDLSTRREIEQMRSRLLKQQRRQEIKLQKHYSGVKESVNRVQRLLGVARQVAGIASTGFGIVSTAFGLLRRFRVKSKH